jgi:hypothetical protein
MSRECTCIELGWGIQQFRHEAASEENVGFGCAAAAQHNGTIRDFRVAQFDVFSFLL